MNKANALVGLIGSYGDSEDESDDGSSPAKRSSMPAADGASFQSAAFAQGISTGASATIHPAPIPHCPWSACYDETSGFTYYWNHQTNAVTWEAPPEYLLALKIAQQQLSASGSAEVSAEEWQLYQQALAEKQSCKVISKPATIKKVEKSKQVDKRRVNNKRRFSDDDECKIELITSYHNSDSESDHESESPIKKATVAPPLPKQPPPPTPKAIPKATPKKQKLKHVEYGPTLPPNQNYTVPIGPDLPPELRNTKPMSPEVMVENGVSHPEDKTTKNTEENQDENTLLKRLKDKAKLLEKLGGELPSGLEKIIREETGSGTASPAKSEDKKSLDIDDLLEEIEKKELPKAKSRRIDMFDEDSKGSLDSSRNSPRSGVQTPISGVNTPVEAKPLFPSIKNIDEVATTALFPSATFPSTVEIDLTEKETKPEQPPLPPEKGNVYLSDPNETVEKPTRKKLRISNSVLPERKTAELPSYTTKYSQHIEGFSSERTGLGFSKDEDESDSPKETISYGKGLMFTKGEVLNQERKDEDLDDLTDLVEAKLKHLNQLQPSTVSPVQEMLIQMQTLSSAYRARALPARYWRTWARGAHAALGAHERAAAPPGWSARFSRSEGRYQYIREADGFEQWEYPAVANTDMDICTTPPHPGIEAKESPPPLPEVSPPAAPPPPPPPPPALPAPPAPPAAPPAPPAPPARVQTPPPPAWCDPPPPGTDDPPPLPTQETKQEIGDELLSFYNDIAELEKESTPVPSSPELKWERERTERERDRDKECEREKHCEKEKEKDRDKSKKKTKVKISSSMGFKHKTVSSMVAKWQQVADEIHSD